MFGLLLHSLLAMIAIAVSLIISILSRLASRDEATIDQERRGNERGSRGRRDLVIQGSSIRDSSNSVAANRFIRYIL
jgi:hypothetical protein